MIDFNKYNSKKVGILGLGITGESIFKSIKDSNAEIYLWDDDISLREKYFNKEIFNVGDVVKNLNGDILTISERKTNFIVAEDGNKYFINDLKI